MRWMSLALFLPAVAGAAGGGPVVPGAGGVALDGYVDGAYQMLDEDTYAAPDLGLSGQTTSSDLIGESSANLVWFGFGDANYLGFDPGGGLFVRNSGSADIHRIYVTWDATDLYIAIEGPNAYHEGFGTGTTDMTLVVAIDPAQTALTETTPTLDRTQVPENKAIDFAGWAPSHFVVVRAVGLTWQDASFYEGLVEQAVDVDLLDQTGLFAVDGRHDTALTEIRVDWSLLGGAPPQTTGDPWNLAVYTTFPDDLYDAFDSAPGLGQVVAFEELGDVACDSDHCTGNVDPVTGAEDACDCVAENDGGLAAGISVTATESPGSDNAGAVLGADKDIDTIQGYFRVDNVGELCFTDTDGDGVEDCEDGCPDDPLWTDPGPYGCGHSDDDGILDVFEDHNGNGNLDDDDTDGDGTPDYLDDDDDGDGVPTAQEQPDPDGDGDSLDAVDTDGDGTPDYLDNDTPTGTTTGTATGTGTGTATGTTTGTATGSGTGTGDATGTGTGAAPDPADEKGECGCQSGSGPQGAWLLALPLVLAARRRR